MHIAIYSRGICYDGMSNVFAVKYINIPTSKISPENKSGENCSELNYRMIAIY